jgi:hypothetical protein
MDDAGTREEATMDLMDHPSSEHETQWAQADREELLEHIARAVRRDGTIETPEGLRLRRASSPTELAHGVSFPALCVVAQGSKPAITRNSSARRRCAMWNGCGKPQR